MGPDLPGPGSDKLIHFGAYGLMALLGLPLASNARSRALMLGFVLGLGAALEAVQAPIPYRSASGGDLVANCLGVLGGSLLWLVVTWRRQAQRRSHRATVDG